VVLTTLADTARYHFSTLKCLSSRRRRRAKRNETGPDENEGQRKRRDPQWWMEEPRGMALQRGMRAQGPRERHFTACEGRGEGPSTRQPSPGSFVVLAGPMAGSREVEDRY